MNVSQEVIGPSVREKRVPLSLRGVWQMLKDSDAVLFPFRNIDSHLQAQDGQTYIVYNAALGPEAGPEGDGTLE